MVLDDPEVASKMPSSGFLLSYAMWMRTSNKYKADAIPIWLQKWELVCDIIAHVAGWAVMRIYADSYRCL